jgi:hypothetical protein
MRDNTRDEIIVHFFLIKTQKTRKGELETALLVKPWANTRESFA